MTLFRRGKSISKSLLSRDRTWRQAVIDKRAVHMPAFLNQPRSSRECPACLGRGEARDFLDVRGAGFMLCNDCGHIFSKFSPSADFLSDYYGQDKSSQIMTYVNVNQEMQTLRREEIAKPKAHFIHDVFTKHSKFSGLRNVWCDVGCGIGDLLVEAGTLGYVSLGFETDQIQARVARDRGVEVIGEFMEPGSENFSRISECSVVSLINVLEHISDPASTLASISSELKSGAFIAIEVPRNPSLSSIVQHASFAPIFRHISPPEHLHIFSDTSLESMLSAASFAVRGRWLFGSDALELFSHVGHTLGWEQGYEAPLIGEAINAFQESIDASGLSDTQLVVAERI